MAATSSKKRLRPRGTARRDALLDAVIRIVAEVGADAVTHRRVAEVADLPLASTTYWFESKEHLLTAALERAADHDIDAAARVHPAAPTAAADPVALAVDAILDPLDETGHASRGSLLATYALLLEAARRPALRAVTRRWTGRLSRGARPAAGTGRLAPIPRPTRRSCSLPPTACWSSSSQPTSTRTSAAQLRRLGAALVRA